MAKAICKLWKNARRAGEPNASLALDALPTAVRKTIGGYAALLGGIDLLVFTGGIGEHSGEIRRRVCDGLAFMGLTESDPAGKGGDSHRRGKADRAALPHAARQTGSAFHLP